LPTTAPSTRPSITPIVTMVMVARPMAAAATRYSRRQTPDRRRPRARQCWWQTR
jgi:hypothetical protein